MEDGKTVYYPIAGSPGETGKTIRLGGLSIVDSKTKRSIVWSQSGGGVIRQFSSLLEPKIQRCRVTSNRNDGVFRSVF